MSDDKPGRRSGSGADSVLRHMTRDARGAPPPTEQAFDRASFTILVVDDVPASRYAAVRLLQVCGFRTTEAAEGNECLACAESSSAVLLDVNLPDLNGVEVCRVLKTRSPHLPVVLMSAFYVDDLHREAGTSAGADAYLVPPLTPEELGATFDRLLRR